MWSTWLHLTPFPRSLHHARMQHPPALPLMHLRICYMQSTWLRAACFWLGVIHIRFFTAWVLTWALGEPAQLVGPGEVAPGISGTEFRSRRRALAEAMPPGAVAVVASAPQAYMTGMIPYPYRQDADFLYLTGVCQPGVALISQSCFTLFVPNPDPQVGPPPSSPGLLPPPLQDASCLK